MPFAGRPDTFEAFAEAVRTHVEAEARDHADDRWWILEPALVVQRRDGSVATHVIARQLAPTATGRAIARADLPLLPKELGVKRCAVALHVDLLVEDAPVAAIVLAVIGALAAAYQQARVERTAAGTPRLGPWQPAQDLAAEVQAAVRLALSR